MQILKNNAVNLQQSSREFDFACYPKDRTVHTCGRKTLSSVP